VLRIPRADGGGRRASQFHCEQSAAAAVGPRSA
jgi:hypothetical protein